MYSGTLIGVQASSLLLLCFSVKYGLGICLRRKERWREELVFGKKPLRGVRGTWKDALDSVEGSAGVMGFSFTAAPMCVAVVSSPGMIGGLDLEEKYGQSHPHRMTTVWRRLHLRTENTV